MGELELNNLLKRHLRWLAAALAVLPMTSWAQDPPPVESQAAPSAEPEATEDVDWLNEMLKREVEPLPSVEVVHPDGHFQAKVPGKLLEPIGLVNGAHHLMLDFGAGPENLAECYIYDEDLDLAGSLLSFSDGVFEAINTHYGEIQLKAVLDVTAGALAGSPYMGIEWLYRCNTQSGPVAGQAKHLMATKNRRAIYCQSSSVGYGSAFWGLFRALVESIDYGKPLPAPHYAEVSVASFGEHILGVSHQSHRVDGDGDVEVIEKLSMLVPMEDGQSFQAEDSVTMQYSTLKGDLMNQVKVEAANGQIVTHLTLNQFENGAWAVKGGHRGNNIDTVLSTAPVLRSSLGAKIDFRDLIKDGAKDGAMWSTPAWVPDVDPVRILETKGTLVNTQPKGSSVKLETGPMVLTALTDPSFSMVLVSVPVGGAEMVLRRIYQSGDVFYPLTLPPKEKASVGEGAEPTDSEIPTEKSETGPKP